MEKHGSFKNFSFVAFSRVLGGGLQAAFYLIFAAILSPAQYGELSYYIGIAGVSKEELSSNLKIHPNPTNTLIQIEIENYNGSFEAKLYGFSGKLLETANNTNLSLADYPNGVYLLKVVYGDRVEEVKVIKD